MHVCVFEFEREGEKVRMNAGMEFCGKDYRALHERSKTRFCRFEHEYDPNNEIMNNCPCGHFKF